MKPTVYIFRGAPASGKSTLVPKFCELLPKPVSLISQDTLRWGFHLVGRTISDVQDEEHLFAYQNTLLLYEQYLKNGHYSIVIEGLFTWNDASCSQGNVKELLDLADTYGFNAKSIVLLAAREELLERNAKRSYAVPAAEFALLYSNVYKIIDPNEIVINSTNQSLHETLQMLKSLI